MTAPLAGRNAVVTGSSSGIGAAIAIRLMSDGATVLGIDRTASAELPTLVCDLSDTDGLVGLAERVLNRLESVDILVNCAGVFHSELVSDLTWSAYERTLRVNLHAPVFLMSILGAQMAARGYGRIVNVTSVHAKVGEAGSVAYDISKAGLEAATRTVAIELASRGVLANSIAPGFVATAMSVVDGVDELTSESFRTMYVDGGRLPLRRAAQPEEIAVHVAHLVDETNTYITGQTITIDGGLTARF